MKVLARRVQVGSGIFSAISWVNFVFKKLDRGHFSSSLRSA